MQNKYEQPILKGCAPILFNYKIGIIAILVFFSAHGLGLLIYGWGKHPTSWIDTSLLFIMSLSVIILPFTGIIRKISNFMPFKHYYILEACGMLPYARWFFEIIFDWLIFGIGITLFGITVHNLFI